MDEIDREKNSPFWTDLWWGDLFYVYNVPCFFFHTTSSMCTHSPRDYLCLICLFSFICLYTDMKLPSCMDKDEG